MMRPLSFIQKLNSGAISHWQILPARMSASASSKDRSHSGLISAPAKRLLICHGSVVQGKYRIINSPPEFSA